jgi:anti-anti-sigma regulatory factor
MELNSRIIEDMIVLEFKGNIADDFFDHIRSRIFEIIVSDHKKVILDLHLAKGADKRSCDFLIKMKKIMNKYDRELVICGCSKKLTKISEVTGIASVYKMYNSLGDAKQYFRARQELRKKLVI